MKMDFLPKFEAEASGQLAMFSETKPETQESVRYIEEIPGYLTKLEKFALWKTCADYLRNKKNTLWSFHRENVDPICNEINRMYPDLDAARILQTQNPGDSRFVYKIILDIPYAQDFKDILANPDMELNLYETDLESIEILPSRNESMVS